MQNLSNQLNKSTSKILTHRSFWLAVLVFFVALLPRVTTLGHTFIVNDEPLYWKWSSQFANALFSGNWRETMIGIGYPSVTVVWLHTLGAELQYLLRLLTDPVTAETVASNRVE